MEHSYMYIDNKGNIIESYPAELVEIAMMEDDNVFDHVKIGQTYIGVMQTKVERKC